MLSGLAFFATVLALAALPVVAQGHTVSDIWRPCTIVGTRGDDLLRGTAKADVICGKGGKDTIAGNSGPDIIRGGSGADLIQGDAGRDVILAGDGNDIVYSYDGSHDHVNGGRGYDRLPRHDRLLDRIRAFESRS